jgi:hypothetical protein
MAKKSLTNSTRTKWMQEIKAAATCLHGAQAPVSYMWDASDKHLRIYGRHLDALLNTLRRRMAGFFPAGQGIPVFSCYWDRAPLPQKMIIVKLHLFSAKAHLANALRILNRLPAQTQARAVVAKLLAGLRLNDGALNYHIRKVTAPFHVKEARRIVMKQYVVMANGYLEAANRLVAEQRAFARTIRW